MVLSILLNNAYPSTNEKALHLTKVSDEINNTCEYMRSVKLMKQ